MKQQNLDQKQWSTLKFKSLSLSLISKRISQEDWDRLTKVSQAEMSPLESELHRITSLLLQLVTTKNYCSDKEIEDFICSHAFRQNKSSDKGIYVQKFWKSFAIPKRRKKRLGKILIKNQMITPLQLGKVLKLQKKAKALLGEMIIASGYASESEVVQALAEQFNLPYFRLQSLEIPEEIVALLPTHIVVEYKIIPIQKIEDHIVIVSSNPKLPITDIQFITGHNIKVVLASSKDIQTLIDKYYPTQVTSRLDKEYMSYSSSLEEDKEDKGEWKDFEKLTESDLYKAIKLPLEKKEQSVNLFGAIGVRYGIEGKERKLTRTFVEEEFEKFTVEAGEVPKLDIKKPLFTKATVPKQKKTQQIAETESSDLQEEKAKQLKYELPLMNFIVKEGKKHNAKEILIDLSSDQAGLYFCKQNLWYVSDLPRSLVENIASELKKQAQIDINKQQIIQAGYKRVSVFSEEIPITIQTISKASEEFVLVKICHNEKDLKQNYKQLKLVIGKTRPEFEKYLSDEAGEPGILESLITNSQWLMKKIQAIVGLYCVYPIHCLDTLINTVANYFRSIHYSWKTMRSVRKKFQRREKSTQMESLQEDLQKMTENLYRIFSLHKTEINRYEPKFALEILLTARKHIDEIKRDLQFLTSNEMKKTVRKTLANFLVSFIPNPVEIYLSFKDILVIGLLMNYSRFQIENTCQEAIQSYKEMVDSLTSTNETLQSEKIESIRTKLQRVQQILVKPVKYVYPKYWSRYDLLWELQRWQTPKYQLELERWMRPKIEKAFTQKGLTLTNREKKLYEMELDNFALRCRSEKILSEHFLW